MQSWYRKGKKRKMEKEKKLNRVQNLQIDIVVSLIMLAYLIVLFGISIVDYSDKMGFILAILSAVVTFCFEGYEWFYLVKKNKSNKHALIPWIYSALLFLGLIVLSIILNVKIETTKWSNAICSGTLLLYIVFMTIRKIIEDCRR